MYCIYDRKAMRYGKPTLFINDDVAIRDTRFVLSQSINMSIVDDCELYAVGEFDETRGVINAYDKPVFISNFGE